MSRASIDLLLERKVTIRFPNLFSGFLIDNPVVNPAYEAVRSESETWLQSIMSLSPQQYKRVHYCDFTYFCAVLVPHASHERLRVISDWGSWIFLLDDMFDEGELRHDLETSRHIINNLLSTMLPGADRTSGELVVQAHYNIYKRLAAGSAPSVLNRYVQAMQSYCAGVLQHVEDHVTDRVCTIQEMLETRRMSIGVFPMYSLVEFAYGLDLPDEVFCHPTIQALENLGAEFVMLMNDILSYQKEETENCPFNTVAVCRINGSSAQKAFDDISVMISARFAAWDQTVNMLPTWGKDVDAQVHQYIKGIQNIVQANISWSFRTGRYFGATGEKVRQSREIDVLLLPPFLPHQRKGY